MVGGAFRRDLRMRSAVHRRRPRLIAGIAAALLVTGLAAGLAAPSAGAKPTAPAIRKLNQSGNTSALPNADQHAAGEIALDIEAVRAVCRTCKIILLEANDPTTADLAAADTEAITPGATEISNSFGAPERTV